MDLQGLNETAIAAARKHNVDDAIALSAQGREEMIRFANNSVTVVKRVDETEIMVYIAKGGRRAIASTSNLDEKNIKRFVADLHGSMKGLTKEEYVPLPDKALRFAPSRGTYDKKLDGVGEMLPDLAGRAIESASRAGAKRTAGVINASSARIAILTTSGTRGTDSSNCITLNVRSFGDNDSSGHGLSCSSTLASFDPEEAGRRAGSHAKKMEKASEPEPGTYQVLLSPTVAANLVETVGQSASAFSVDAGLSYLAEKVGKRVGSEAFTLTDHGCKRL